MDDMGTLQITHGIKAHITLGSSRNRALLSLVHPRATNILSMEGLLSGNRHTHGKKGDDEKIEIKQSLEVEYCSFSGNPRVRQW